MDYVYNNKLRIRKTILGVNISFDVENSINFIAIDDEEFVNSIIDNVSIKRKYKNILKKNTTKYKVW